MQPSHLIRELKPTQQRWLMLLQWQLRMHGTEARGMVIAYAKAMGHGRVRHGQRLVQPQLLVAAVGRATGLLVLQAAAVDSGVAVRLVCCGFSTGARAGPKWWRTCGHLLSAGMSAEASCCTSCRPSWQHLHAHRRQQPRPTRRHHQSMQVQLGLALSAQLHSSENKG